MHSTQGEHYNNDEKKKREREWKRDIWYTAHVVKIKRGQVDNYSLVKYFKYSVIKYCVLYLWRIFYCNFAFLNLTLKLSVTFVFLFNFFTNTSFRSRSFLICDANIAIFSLNAISIFASFLSFNDECTTFKSLAECTTSLNKSFNFSCSSCFFVAAFFLLIYNLFAVSFLFFCFFLSDDKCWCNLSFSFASNVMWESFCALTCLNNCTILMEKNNKNL